jgi:Sec-independent protein translocase protein TatA
MDILGIGPLELLFLFIIVLIVLGPRDMMQTGQQIGKFLGDLMRSDFWKALQTAQREMRTLPNRLARESGIDDLNRQLDEEGKRIADIGGEISRKLSREDESFKTAAWTELIAEEQSETPEAGGDEK